MSIDQEDTRIELIHAEDEAKYLLRDSREILAILKHIVSARALVSARLAPGRESYLSALIQVDDGEDGVLLDASADPAQNERILRADALDCVTQLDKVRIQFLLKGARLVDEGGSPGFRCALPDSLLRLQRREFYRLQTPLSHAVTCTLALPQADGSRRNTELRILDISGGGVAIAVPTIAEQLGQASGLVASVKGIAQQAADFVGVPPLLIVAGVLVYVGANEIRWRRRQRQEGWA